jgi:hypothetical protein
MREMSKSALEVAREALAVAGAALPRHASRFSRRDGYPLPQLFAVLVVRKFLRQDYRGIEALLGEWSDLRAAIGLAKVPDHSTLCLAEAKLAARGLSTDCSPPASRGRGISACWTMPAPTRRPTPRSTRRDWRRGTRRHTSDGAAGAAVSRGRGRS